MNKRNYTKLVPAPRLLKKGLLQRIEREIEVQGKHGGAPIYFRNLKIKSL